MPRFTFRTPPVAESSRRQAAAIAARRFPEVDIVGCRTEGDDRQIWECRAPNASRLHRWAAAARLPAADLRMLAPEDWTGLEMRSRW
jgi:hypothetical protein